MIATAEQTKRGRFAPSPSGPLHLGSLLTAVGSYVDAKHQKAEWLVRIEDIDHTRSKPAYASQILETLERFGLYWDGEVLYQHTRLDAYREAFDRLAREGHLYPCYCSRAQVTATTIPTTHGRYTQVCKPDRRTTLSPITSSAITAAWRFDTESFDAITMHDRLQGSLTQHVHQTVGDFVIRRRDGEFTYQLAVVVDDAFQGITDVVRGADLLDNTPRQRLLQTAVGWPSPTTLHLPVLVEKTGEKLSKSRQALALDPTQSPALLSHVLRLLGHAPPTDLVGAPVTVQLQWAVEAWRIERLPRQTDCCLSTDLALPTRQP
jgi:glutamyl-Q tRNA(Asp) synthetase